ncbi:DddA-like double-stranded DNA deaminase toxin [Crossiella cryophila]|uniref:Uncharacterized protein n=1 Tax=Crossiella cryophila TaxID=43355 RepID=A0A7W7CFI9_9PSEU|nr:DddA-like double-stranded DNA deaminase toxin [Crossiella cryophila]MBB4680261.1 hypothetical protein [Crossiella cryophila]
MAEFESTSERARGVRPPVTSTQAGPGAAVAPSATALGPDFAAVPVSGRLTPAEITRIMLAAKDLDEAKLRLGLGPVTDQALHDFLVRNGFRPAQPAWTGPTVKATPPGMEIVGQIIYRQSTDGLGFVASYELGNRQELANRQTEANRDASLRAAAGFMQALAGPMTDTGPKLTKGSANPAVQPRAGAATGPPTTTRTGPNRPVGTPLVPGRTGKPVPPRGIRPIGTGDTAGPSNRSVAAASPQPGIQVAEQVRAAREYFPGHDGAVGSLLVEGRPPMRIKSGVDGGPSGGTHRGGIPRGEGHAFTAGGPSQGNIATHVEGHSAAIMHQQGIQRATLVVSQPECKVCAANLPSALPPGAELRVIHPGGSETIYRANHAR